MTVYYPSFELLYHLGKESEVPDIHLLEPEVVEGGREGEEGRKDGKEPEEEGGRRGRRAASQISFKEPSLRGKMRQVTWGGDGVGYASNLSFFAQFFFILFAK